MTLNALRNIFQPDNVSFKSLQSQLRELAIITLEYEHEPIPVANSLGAEDMILIHAISGLEEEYRSLYRVFLLDTGRLHYESYRFVDRVRDRYNMTIRVFSPPTKELEAMVEEKGMLSFYNSVAERKECCTLRKVVGLKRALAGSQSWVTGLRRAQSPARAELQAIEEDLGNKNIKIAPLYNWSDSELWTIAQEEDVLLHPLHSKGYPSIGCAPCTRPIPDWSITSARNNSQKHPIDIRAGRWWWEESSGKECGLHVHES